MCAAADAARQACRRVWPRARSLVNVRRRCVNPGARAGRVPGRPLTGGIGMRVLPVVALLALLPPCCALGQRRRARRGLSRQRQQRGGAVPVYRGSAAAPGHRGAGAPGPPVGAIGGQRLWFVDPAPRRAGRLPHGADLHRRGRAHPLRAAPPAGRLTRRSSRPLRAQRERQRQPGLVGPAVHAVRILDQMLEHAPRHTIVLVQPAQCRARPRSAR